MKRGDQGVWGVVSKQSFQPKTALFLAILAFAPSFSARAEVDATQAVENELFVKWSSQSTAAERMQLLRAWGASVVWESALVPGLVRLELSAGSSAAEDGSRPTERTFKKSKAIEYSTFNFKVRRDLVETEAPVEGTETLSESLPSDRFLNRQWGILGTYGVRLFEALGRLTSALQPIRVAVIDTGVDPAHPDLYGRVGQGYDFIDRTDVVTDHHDHGSHVAGVIAATGGNGIGIFGMSQSAEIIPLRAVPTNGDETDADVIEAFEFAVKSGAKVANCSFGKSKSSAAVKEVMEAAGKQGLLIVIAAGNSSEDLAESPSFPASFQTSNSIVVSSIAENGSLSNFSNYGKAHVDLAAPGSKIFSTIRNARYSMMSGTSMASPHVAGAAAVVWAAYPQLTLNQVKRALTESVRQSSELVRVTKSGGTLDVEKALQKAAELVK